MHHQNEQYRYSYEYYSIKAYELTIPDENSES